MKNNKKGFSLIELLVVIAIIGILLLISFPLVDNLVEKNNKNKYNAYRDVIEEATKEYMNDLGFIVSGCYEVSYEKLSDEGLIQGIDKECKNDTKVYVISDEKGNVTDYKVNLVCGGKNVIEREYKANTCKYEVVQYKDSFGDKNQDKSGASFPELKDNMIPVKYDGENWIVADVDNVKFSLVFEEDYSWYNYNKGYWANAVIIKDDAYNKYVKDDKYKMGQIVKEEDTISWWVWIPKFSYKSLASSITTLEVAFADAPSDYKLGAEWMNKYNGIWISKYELSEENNVVVSKNVDNVDDAKYITDLTANEFIGIGKEINGAHTITTSEYDSAGILSYSKYGSQKNNSKYTTNNNSGVYNMASDTEFTAGNLRGLRDWYVEFKCNNTCKEGKLSKTGEAVFNSKATGLLPGTSGATYLGYKTDQFFKNNIIDIYNINYKWYVNGTIYPNTKCEGTYGCTKYGANIILSSNAQNAFYKKGETMASPNEADVDYLGSSFSWFKAGHPTYTISYDGTWKVAKNEVTAETDIAKLWIFKGNAGIDSYVTNYNDISVIPINEIEEQFNSQCDLITTCTDKEEEKEKRVYTTAFTKYAVRVRTAMY